MQLHFAKVLEQVVNHSRLGHIIRLAQQGTPVKAFYFTAYIRQEVAGVEYAFYIVERAFIHRQAAVPAVDNHFQHPVKVGVIVYVGDLGTRSHNLAGGSVAELKYTLQHIALLAGLYIGYFQGLGKFIGGNLLGLLHNHAIDQRSAAYEHSGDRREEPGHGHHGATGHLGPFHRVVIGT